MTRSLNQCVPRSQMWVNPKSMPLSSVHAIQCLQFSRPSHSRSWLVFRVCCTHLQIRLFFVKSSKEAVGSRTSSRSANCGSNFDEGIKSRRSSRTTNARFATHMSQRKLKLVIGSPVHEEPTHHVNQHRRRYPSSPAVHYLPLPHSIGTTLRRPALRIWPARSHWWSSRAGSN